MMNHLDLFSGIGGFSLGLEATGGFKTVGFCEIEPYCQQVLKRHWPDVPIYNDVRGLKHDGAVDIVTGGYPCQPFSTAGKRKGQSDPRHLWPAMFGIIEAKRPRWVIGENVAGHISMGLDEVLADLERAAYSAIPFIIPACAVGAPHRRDRIWVVAWDTNSNRATTECQIQGRQDSESNRTCGNVADPTELQRDGGDHHSRISARAESFSELGNSDRSGIVPDTERDGQHDTAQRIGFAGCPDQGRMPEPERPCGAPADVSAYAEGERLQGERFGGTRGGAHDRIITGRGLAGSIDQADDGNGRGGTTGGESPKKGSGVRLNPQFVEWMMGYPTDWTVVDNPPPKPRRRCTRKESKPLETA